jgi:N-acetylglucosamine-6-phosphate deacetylase
MLLLKNCKYLSPEGFFTDGDIEIRNEEIVSSGRISSAADGEVLDLKGLRIIPGFIDIHFHGAMGYDIMDAPLEGFKQIANYLVKNGTTSFLATTITSPKQNLENTLKMIYTIAEKEDNIFASILGVHVEGPFINQVKKGCHNANWMRCPAVDEFEDLKKILGTDLKTHMTVAPEVEGALEFIKYASANGASISIGHSNATADITKKAIENGAVSFTHLFNAMRGIDHREPGVAGAALNSKCFVELICDGVHVHPDIVKLIYKLKGSESIILVTDAMKAAGLGDGQYEFGGFKVIVHDRIARKEDGTLASSTLTMLNAVKNIIEFTGSSLEEAVLMATRNPAQAIGAYDKVGSIETGKRADLVALNDNLDIAKVFSKGKLVFSAS